MKGSRDVPTLYLEVPPYRQGRDTQGKDDRLENTHVELRGQAI